MKTVITHNSNQLKVLILLSGEVTITLPGGKQITGRLEDKEVEQIAYRVYTLTKGEASFDPAPSDLLALHDVDVATLEKQNAALEEVRAANADLAKSIETHAKTNLELIDRLAACEKDLVDARTNLKNARIEISELNEKLGITAPPVKPIIESEPIETEPLL